MATSLTIFGATGGTGSRLVQQALRAGLGVTAVTRNDSRVLLDLAGPGLTVVRADVMDPDAILEAVASGDAVVSALGSRAGRAPTTILRDAMTSVIAAMKEAGRRRLVVVTASGMFTHGDTIPIKLAKRALLWPLLREPYADLLAAEDLIRRSGLDWTIVRPSRLTSRPRTGVYRTDPVRNVRGGNFISRADLADFLLRAATDPGTAGQAISIGY